MEIPHSESNVPLTHGIGGDCSGGHLVPPSYSTPQFDPDDYRHELEDFQLSEEQEVELLNTLWKMMSTMVDIGWGLDTVQLLLPEIFEQASSTPDDHLEQIANDTDSIHQIEEQGGST